MPPMVTVLKKTDESGHKNVNFPMAPILKNAVHLDSPCFGYIIQTSISRSVWNVFNKQCPHIFNADKKHDLKALFTGDHFEKNGCQRLHIEIHGGFGLEIAIIL